MIESKKIKEKPSFPEELQYRFWKDLDRLLLGIYCLTFLAVGAIIVIGALQPVKQGLSAEEALKIRKRYAKLVLNEEEKKPELKEEAKPDPEKIEPEKPKAEVEKTESRPENTEQREERKKETAEERAKQRDKVAEELDRSGLFAELSASDDGSGNGVIDDVLAQASARDLSNAKLSGVDFGKRPTTDDLKKERRGERVAATGLGAQNIEKAEIKKINSTGDVQLASPESLEGEGKADLNRSPESIRKVIEKIQTNIKLQFEKYLKQEPDLAGQVDVDFTIKADGTVLDARIIRSTLKHAAFERRLVSMIARLHFPPASGDIRITYPFVFTSSKS